MIKNISLPEIFTTGNLVGRENYEHLKRSKKEPWSIVKALENNQFFSVVSLVYNSK